jgi:hypothetical protein
LIPFSLPVPVGGKYSTYCNIKALKMEKYGINFPLIA